MKAIKYFFAVISIGAVAFGFSLFCACTNNSEYYLKHSKIYSLQEAYGLGLLSRDDLMHIAYYECGKVFRVSEDCENAEDSTNWEEVGFVPEQARPELTFETEDKIKSAYYYHNLDDFKDGNGNLKYGKDNLTVSYYGCYNGCYIALVDSDFWAYPAVIDVVCVGGIVWSQPYPYSIKAFVFEN